MFNSVTLLELTWLLALAGIEIGFSAWPRAQATTNRRASNIAMTIVDRLAVPLAATPALLWLQHNLPVSHEVAQLPVLLGFFVTLCLLDAAGYFFHLVSHRVNLLWRFHQIHHLDEDFDITTGLRVHPGEALVHALIEIVIVVACGIPAPLYLAFRILSAVMAIFHHANILIPEKLDRALGLVVMTPSMHVPHHHEKIENTDSNYGFILCWWDRMFGTFNTARRTADWRIGLDYAPDLSFPQLLVEPFRPLMLKQRMHQASDPAPANQNAAIRIVASNP